MVSAGFAAMALVSGASYALAGAVQAYPDILPSRADALKAQNDGLRLVKTSDEDPGVWVTEDEKFEQFISKKIGFVDITETLELEAIHLSNLEESSFKAQAIPTAPSHQTEANALIARATQSNLSGWANGMANIYNRYYRGSYATQSATWMYNTVVSVASSNTAIQVSRYTHSYNQPSVIARIPGTASGVVVVSAHYDSVGSSTTGRAPGADDNASGVVVLLEALRVLASARYAPRNTLEFHFYSGEEGGLLGSRDIMQNLAC